MSHILDERCEMYVFILLVVLGSATAQDDGRIIGGSNAIIQGRDPYHVSLQNVNFEHICGGAILRSKWVLTSARCLEVPPAFVMAGSMTLDPPGSRHIVAKSIKHPLYNDILPLFDIGMVQIKDEFNEFGGTFVVGRISLAGDEIPDGAVMTALGWGWTTYPNKTIPNHLQSLDMPKISNSECRAIWSKSNSWTVIWDGMICVRKPTGQGLCHGDSGGPVIFKGQLYGIASFSRPCADGYPDVLTKVSKHALWIDLTIFFNGW